MTGGSIMPPHPDRLLVWGQFLIASHLVIRPPLETVFGFVRGLPFVLCDFARLRTNLYWISGLKEAASRSAQGLSCRYSDQPQDIEYPDQLPFFLSFSRTLLS